MAAWARRSACPGRSVVTGAICVLAAMGTTGCAARAVADGAYHEPAATRQAAPPPETSLEAFIARVRQLAAEARPPKNDAAQTVETWDGLLAAALADLERRPTAARHRAVALEYRRLGVLDTAHQHFTRAIELDRRDPAAYDGRARLWRDFGFAGQGLGDAYRAAYLAPGSAEAANTLGTLFEAMGDLRRARTFFARAAALDPSAAYAVTNLCHADTMLGRREALAQCSRAVALAPGSSVARNNMGLAYAAAGAFDLAQQEFSAVGSQAVAAYNLGIVFMAAARLPEAAEAFREAWLSDPTMAIAAQRLWQARAASAR